ncbi:MAG: hypothetical protein MJ127_04485 [Mogibacterium sp.]|nr:hypothetical protein [Mogibacterium sp.]
MAKYGLIGRDLSHSQSRLLHSYLGSYDYDYIEVADASGLKAVLEDKSYDGFNVTIPYKQEVMKYLDELSPRAEAAKAVNTVRRMPDGRLMGFNTDVRGFKRMLGDKAKDAKCLILGTGGAAGAVAIALEEIGAKSIVFVSRDPASGRERTGGRHRVISYNALPHYFDTDIIINATPVGQLPDIDRSPLNEMGKNVSIFTDLKYAVDLIYNPFRTKFLQDSKRITGCKTMSGLEMLIYQAMDSRDCWHGRKSIRIDERILVKRIKRHILNKQLNIVAVGMPGSGKTTIFRRYAYENHFDFVDVDAETEGIMGARISDVLGDAEKGEQYFREKESEAVRKVSRLTNTVIATGGGSILNPLNRDMLRANGVVIYVKRPLEYLSTRNRPISQKIGVLELFTERDRIYRRMSDISVYNTKAFGGEGEDNAREFNRDMRKYADYIGRCVEKYLTGVAENKWT